jgi:hypothetical protein
VAVNTAGDVYVTGSFESPNITLGSFTLTNTGPYNPFFAKYDGTGNVLWATGQVGGVISLDGSGNVYLVAGFTVTKCNSAGGVLSAGTAPGGGTPTCSTFDPAGNLYIAGYFQSLTVSFGNITLTNSNPNTGGNTDFFVASYDSGLNVRWAARAGGNSSQDGYLIPGGIAVDSAGNVSVAGTFGGPHAYFGGTTLDNYFSGGDVFVVHYDTAGNFMWVRQGADANGAQAYAIAADGSGNIFVTGTFSQTGIIFGATTLPGPSGMFLVKYGSAGNLLWAEGVSGQYPTFGRALALHPTGTIYVAGYFQSATLTFGSQTLTNSGFDEIFMAKFDGAGNPLWAKSGGGTSDDRGYAVAVDSLGQAYLTGYFLSPTAALGGTTLSNNGGTDVVIAKLSVVPPSILVQPVSQTLSVGTNVTFSVSASGDPTLTYQWWFKGTNLISGATSATLLISNIQPVNIAGYSVVVSNSAASVTSQVATLTIPTELVFAPVNGSGRVAISPTAPYYLGQAIMLTASAGRYYTFLRWSDGNTNAIRNYTVGLSNVLTAIFTNTVPLETVVLKQWEQDFGGSGDDVLYSLQQTSDGGCILGGSSSSGLSGTRTSTNYGGYDYWVVKLDGNGNKVWDKSFGGTGDDYLYALQQTSDGGYILGGGSSASSVSPGKTSPSYGGFDYWVVKLDPSGNKIWEQSFGGTGDDNLNSLQQTSDGGYILGGGSSASSVSPGKTSPSYGGFDYWVVKVDANGNKLWEQSFGGGGDEVLYSLQQTSDGGYIPGGFSNSGVAGNKTSTNFGGSDYWALKLDANGTKQWEQSFGGSGNDVLYSLQHASDAGFILGGSSASGLSGNKTNAGYGDLDFWVVKVDANGSKQWDQSFGGNGPDVLSSLQQTSDGGCMLGGYSASGVSGNKTSASRGGYDYWLVKADANGNKQWEQSFGGSLDDYLVSLQQTSDGGYILGGFSNSGASGNKTSANFGGLHDYWVIKLATPEVPIGTPLVLVNGQYNPSNSFSIPATNSIQVTLQTSFTDGYVFYTLDGSAPTPGEPDTIQYAAPGSPGSPFSVTNSVIVTATAFSSDDTGNIEADADPVAIIVVPVYGLTNTTPGGGSVAFSPAGGVYLSNTVVTLSATPSNGWSFLRWEGAVTNISNPLNLTMDSSKTIRAIFATSITTNPPSGGAIALSPPEGPYAYGSTVRLIGVPNSTKRFNRWFNNLSGPTDNPLDFVVLSNSPSITAFFAGLPANNFTLTTLLDGFGTVTRSPNANAYASNTTVQVTAIPDAGYLFMGWSGDANGAQNPLSIALNSNKVITAAFSSTAPTNTPPTVLVTNPLAGATFTIPVAISLGASASDSDGTIIRVEFYDGGTFISSVTNAPYTLSWSNVTVAVHVLTAQAIDNLGARGTSGPVSITVQTALPQVALLSPTNGNVFVTPASILVSAVASDADNSIARVELYSQASTNNSQPSLLTSITNPPYNFTWSGMATGGYSLTARAVDSYGPIVTSAPVAITVTPPPTTNPPLFVFSQTNFPVNESNGSVAVTVLNNGDAAGLVSYTTIDGSAHGGSGFSGDYTTAQGALSFAAGQHSTNLIIAIRDNYLTGPDIQFTVQLFNPSAGALGSPSNATVTIHENDIGGATNSLLTTAAPSAQPSTSGALTVLLMPPEANGQWRFPWDQGWRTNGQTAANLEAGNYPLQFRDVSNYLAYPPTLTVAVTNNGTTSVTNQYFPTLPPGGGDTGSLTVNIGPSTPTGAGWRFFGESSYRAAGSTASGLLADIYFIEFAPVSGWSKPASRSVQVYGGQGAVVSANYLLPDSLPPNASVPSQVVPSQITDPVHYPFCYNGQLQTDVGYGSGVAVRESVVLTAAHVVFNDVTLSYVNRAWWYLQQEAGVFQPKPLQARGWYVLSGYAGQRTNDLQVGGYAPDQSSPQSRELDAAALYFLTPAARGGYGGYLASDVVPNPYLTGSNLKMLAGYPVDGSAFGQTVQPGLMYDTPAVSSAFTQASNDVYTAGWFISFPGNSGGPIYVQFNGYYYPAAIYLGGLGSGQNSVSVVRAINSDVVNLINLAASRGDAGTNNTGGGVITFVPNPGLSAANPAYVQVVLGPAAAVQAGAGWRLQGDGSFGSSPIYTRAITTNGAVLEFNTNVVGWNPPGSQTAQLSLGALTIVSNAFYTVKPPSMVADLALGIGLIGTTNTSYRIEYRNSLSSGTWLALKTNTLGPGFNQVLPWPPANGPAAFYRAVWLP